MSGTQPIVLWKRPRKETVATVPTKAHRRTASMAAEAAALAETKLLLTANDAHTRERAALVIRLSEVVQTLRSSKSAICVASAERRQTGAELPHGEYESLSTIYRDAVVEQARITARLHELKEVQRKTWACQSRVIEAYRRRFGDDVYEEIVEELSLGDEEDEEEPGDGS